MSYPNFDELTKSPGELAIPMPKPQAPLGSVEDPAVLEFLTEEELAKDEETPDPLVPLRSDGVLDLSAYWHTGMRSTLPEGLIRQSVKPRLDWISSILPEGFTLAIFDAYRPLALQRKLYSAAYADPTLEPGFVTVPAENPLLPPPHLTGAAVDVTLAWSGTPLALGTAFDSFTPRAATLSLEDEPGLEQELRRVLHHCFAAAEFVPYAKEWWHFEYGTPRWAAVRGTRPLFGQPMAVG